MMIPSKGKKIESGKKIKIGLDYHGVIDAKPELFSILSQIIVAAGHEVHIITGTKNTIEFRNTLKELGIFYTYIFSISDYHHDVLHTPMKGYDEGDPWIDATLWNESKANYCLREKIDFHLDDSEIYGVPFMTPFALFKTIAR